MEGFAADPEEARETAEDDQALPAAPSGEEDGQAGRERGRPVSP